MIVKLPFRRELHQGMGGVDVTVLQRALIKDGVRRDHPSGKFARLTHDNVVAYKHKHGLTPADGVVRAGMWRHLQQARLFDHYDVWLFEEKPPAPTTTPRDRALAAAARSYALRGLIGYIQQRPMRDMDVYPNLNTEMDCSEAWKWWRRCGGMSPGDDYGWAYGNTESLKMFGTRLASPGQLRVADAVFYGTGTEFDPFHIGFYAGLLRVYSHGSVGGPYFLPMDYRTVREMRTYEPL